MYSRFSVLRHAKSAVFPAKIANFVARAAPKTIPLRGAGNGMLVGWTRATGVARRPRAHVHRGRGRAALAHYRTAMGGGVTAGPRLARLLSRGWMGSPVLVAHLPGYAVTVIDYDDVARGRNVCFRTSKSPRNPRFGPRSPGCSWSAGGEGLTPRGALGLSHRRPAASLRGPCRPRRRRLAAQTSSSAGALRPAHWS